MNVSLVLKRMGTVFVLVLLPTLFCALIAALEGAREYTAGFLGTAGLLLVPAIVFLLAIPKQSKADTGMRESILLILGVWVVLPLFFIPATWPGLTTPSFFRSLFEAVSAFTTTGAVSHSEAPDWPVSYVLWRSFLHLMGAMSIVVAAILIFSNINSSGPGVQRSSRFRVSPSRSFQDMWPLARLVGMVVLAASILVFLALVLLGTDTNTAWQLSVSAVTTGLVRPETIPSGYLPDGAVIAVGVALIFGSINIMLVLSLIFLDFHRRWDRETVAFLAILAISTALIVPMLSGDASVVARIVQIISIVSTSGIVFVDGAYQSIGLPLLLSLSFVGGAALSSTGGVKISRMLVLASRAWLEFSKLGHPHSVEPFRYRGQVTKTSTVLAVWVYLVAVGATIMIITNFLSFLGHDSASSMSLSLGAMTNSGGLFLGHDVSATRFDEMSYLVLTAAMIMGRLEVLLLLSVVRIDFWRK